MKYVFRRKFADLQGRYQQVIAKRDEAEALAAERLSTITRQAETITRLRDGIPDTPVREPQPAQGDAELRRLFRLSEEARRKLDEQLRTLQAANEAQAAELRDLSEREVTAP